MSRKHVIVLHQRILYFVLYLVLVALSLEGGITFNADRAISLGQTKEDTVLLVGICGVTMVIGRLVRYRMS